MFLKDSLCEQPCYIIPFQIHSFSIQLYVNVCYINAGLMDKRCLTTALFAKEVNDHFYSFIGITHYYHNGRLSHCLLNITNRHTEYWRCAGDRICYDILFYLHSISHK